MTRQRMIKPEFFSSESLGECSPEARLLFVGLWVFGDDAGNTKLAPKKILRSVFPCDGYAEADLLRWLAELEAVGCIRVYEARGDVYLNVPNFAAYQTVRKPSKSTNPPPPESYSAEEGGVWRTRWFSPPEAPPAGWGDGAGAVVVL